MFWKKLTDINGNTLHYVNLHTVAHIWGRSGGGASVRFANPNNQGVSLIEVKEAPAEILSWDDGTSLIVAAPPINQ
jgi:hypothetical protein